MKPEEIQAEWDAFIDYPEGSGKLYVTTTSALIFARSIVEMAEKRERDRLRTQNQALREAANNLLEQAPCDCSHKRRFDDGEHMSGCYLFDLNLAALTAAKQAQPERAPLTETGWKEVAAICGCESITEIGRNEICKALGIKQGD